MHSLFTPTAAGALLLPNRIVMAPMTRSRAVENAAPNALMAEYYAQRATAGLILTEGVAPSANGLGYARTPAIETPEQTAGWKNVTSAVHEKGGRIAIQLMHVGRIARAENQPPGARIVAPSATAAFGNMWTDSHGMQPMPVPEEMSASDIQQTIAEFVQAVHNAREAGFDAIELHSANGYLPNQFLTPNANQRSDSYGGSTENRMRFVLELFDAMAEAWSPDRIGVRISPAGTFNDIQDTEAVITYPLLAAALAQRNAAWLHIVKPAAANYSAWNEIRAAFPGTVILNSGLTKASATQLIDSQEAGLVSFGANYISNPDLVERLRNNWPLAAPDPSTFYLPGPKGYTDYPAFHRA